MRLVALIALVLALAACRSEPPEYDPGPFTIVVNTEERDRNCPAGNACADLRTDTAYLPEYEGVVKLVGKTEATRFVVEDFMVPEKFVFPQMVPKTEMDRYQQRACGFRLAEANGFKASWNGAALLCHEVGHLAGFSHAGKYE